MRGKLRNYGQTGHLKGVIKADFLDALEQDPPYLL